MQRSDDSSAPRRLTTPERRRSREPPRRGSPDRSRSPLRCSRSRSRSRRDLERELAIERERVLRLEAEASRMRRGSSRRTNSSERHQSRGSHHEGTSDGEHRRLREGASRGQTPPPAQRDNHRRRSSNHCEREPRQQNSNVRCVPTACLSTNVSISTIQKEKETFVDVLPSIVDNLVSNPIFAQVPEVSSWVKQLLDYNLIGGKKSRGLATVFAYETLEKPENVTEESLRQVRTVGWCVEMLQAYFLVVDDMMDGSSTRRGMPCWYRLPNVGLGAINDSILIQCSIFETLKANFGKTPMHLTFLELFNEALLFTSMGQHLDYTMAHRNKNDYSLFTIERYYSIVKYKTSYYTFKLPVALGHYLANITDIKTHIMVEDICLDMGKLFQIQDDYLDCYGEETVTGKAGTDIQEGKCSWLAVNALQRCNDTQLAHFIECYASKEQNHIDRIKLLYEELSLPKIYEQEERIIYDSILRKCDALPNNAKTLFLTLLDMMYKRKQ